MRPITDRRERLDDRRRRAGLPPTDADVLGREIDPRLDHAVDPGKRVLDGPDAAAAADPRHGELALAQALAYRPAGKPGFVACSGQGCAVRGARGGRHTSERGRVGEGVVVSV